MELAVVFALGVVNFAMHVAVLHHRRIWTPGATMADQPVAVWFSLGIEYALLFASLLMVAHGSESWAWGYGLYTVANGAGAWFLLGRIG
ncbi:hypothetical protein GTZ99_15690 [Novosphingobium sp. FSY-8]|uniref:Uncharacterized protein n=1 Tax=Novosphingobium ovatum TaxID=1908523 RepID=A0ABW9XHY1_9SPHN|nr:hypothetical protein [Novosphingobium ovatum]NBC37997.1 hypothetical protein [Novosphingobium ovatum]